MTKDGVGDRDIVTHSRALAWSLMTIPLETALPGGSLR